MPHDSDSIPLPRPLLEALDETVDPAERPRFIHDAIAAALLHRRLAQAGDDPGVEPWWPLQRADFVILSSGEYQLERVREEEE